jgi:hypothetical protein
MATESTRQQPSGISTLLWAVSFFFVFALIVVIWVRSSGAKEGYEDKRAAERLKIRQDLWTEADAKLATSAIVDQAKGIVRLPIADAKKAVIGDLKAKKTGPSQIKVDPWLPMPPPPDPNSKEPPTPALPSAPQGADTVRFETAQSAAK